MKFDEFYGHFNVSRETYDNLNIYVQLLIKWNQKINLVGRTTVEDIWQRHIIDSAQLWSYIHGNSEIVDIGTGAGFPGMVLSILGAKHITLIDSNHKKIQFLKTVSRETNQKTEIVCGRIEDVSENKFDLVISRALTDINNLLAYSEALLKTGGKCYFLKGKTWKKEMEDAQEKWHISYNTFESLTSPTSKIIEVNQFYEHESSHKS